MNTKSDIQTILSAKRVAIVGLSRKPKSYSRGVAREFIKRSYDVVGVNPHVQSLDGIECFPTMQSIDPPVDAAIVVLPSKSSDALLTDCLEASIPAVWIRGDEGKRSVTEPLAEQCEARSVRLIDGYCPLMFFEKPGFPHNLHGAFARFFNQVPK
jgi:predicted CoA-binding protein